MNKIIYSISGEDTLGVEQEIFKAGFNNSNNPSVTVGELEIDLANTQVEPNPPLSGEESLLESLKIGLQKFKLGGGTKVEPNPTLVGTEPDLTSIKIADTKYKLASGGGLPTPANAGDAMVFNGTEWAKQSGYGYYDVGTRQTYTWDGDPTGKKLIPYDDAYLCKLTHIPLLNSAQDYIGAVLTVTSTDEGASQTLDFTVKEDDIILEGNLFILSTSVFSSRITLAAVVFQDYPSEGLEKGTYSYYDRTEEPDYVFYISKFSLGRLPSYNTINTNYIYPESSPSSSVYIKTLERWEPETGYAYKIPAQGGIINWDGDTTGKAVLDFGEIQFVKLNDSYVDCSKKDVYTVTITVQEEGSPTQVYDEDLQNITDIYAQVLAGTGCLFMSDGIGLIVCSGDFQLYGIPFAKGAWVTHVEQEGMKAFISKFDYSIPASVVKFDPNYIPLEFNPTTDETTLLKKLKLGNNAYTVSSIEELDYEGRIISSANEKGELIWTPPFEFQSIGTIIGDGTKTEFYLNHNFGNTKLLECICKDSGGTVVATTCVPKNKKICLVTFTTAPASGASYTVELKPKKVVETIKISLDELDTYPASLEEAEDLGFLVREVE